MSNFNKTLIILTRFLKYTHISNFMKIHPLGAEMFHANEQMDRHDEANSHFCNFINMPKNYDCIGKRKKTHNISKSQNSFNMHSKNQLLYFHNSVWTCHKGSVREHCFHDICVSTSMEQKELQRHNNAFQHLFLLYQLLF